jgi:hypothetical protein
MNRWGMVERRWEMVDAGVGGRGELVEDVLVAICIEEGTII